jgi:hypothetical protein
MLASASRLNENVSLYDKCELIRQQTCSTLLASPKEIISAPVVENKSTQLKETDLKKSNSNSSSNGSKASFNLDAADPNSRTYTIDFEEERQPNKNISGFQAKMNKLNTASSKKTLTTQAIKLPFKAKYKSKEVIIKPTAIKYLIVVILTIMAIVSFFFMLTIGLLNLNKCPLEPNIPIYLFFMGMLGVTRIFIFYTCPFSYSKSLALKLYENLVWGLLIKRFRVSYRSSVSLFKRPHLETQPQVNETNMVTINETGSISRPVIPNYKFSSFSLSSASSSSPSRKLKLLLRFFCCLNFFVEFFCCSFCCFYKCCSFECCSSNNEEEMIEENQPEYHDVSRRRSDSVSSIASLNNQLNYMTGGDAISISSMNKSFSGLSTSTDPSSLINNILGLDFPKSLKFFGKRSSTSRREDRSLHRENTRLSFNESASVSCYAESRLFEQNRQNLEKSFSASELAARLKKRYGSARIKRTASFNPQSNLSRGTSSIHNKQTRIRYNYSNYSNRYATHRRLRHHHNRIQKRIRLFDLHAVRYCIAYLLQRLIDTLMVIWFICGNYWVFNSIDNHEGSLISRASKAYYRRDYLNVSRAIENIEKPENIIHENNVSLIRDYIKEQDYNEIKSFKYISSDDGSFKLLKSKNSSSPIEFTSRINYALTKQNQSNQHSAFLTHRASTISLISLALNVSSLTSNQTANNMVRFYCDPFCYQTAFFQIIASYSLFAIIMFIVIAYRFGSITCCAKKSHRHHFHHSHRHQSSKS